VTANLNVAMTRRPDIELEVGGAPGVLAG
jgi:hypothetical protein